MDQNPERVRRLANPFRVNTEINWVSQGSRSSNPGLKLANAFGVISNGIGVTVVYGAGGTVDVKLCSPRQTVNARDAEAP